MKKITITLSLLIGICLLSFGQEVDNRSLSPFTHIKATASVDIVLEQGNSHGARVEAKGVSPDKILTEVEGGKLIISMEKGSYRNIDVTVYVVFKSLESLNLTGSGDISSAGSLSAENLSISLYGSGDIDIDNLSAETMELKLYGSGDIHISGNAHTQDITLNGSGDINTSGLKGSYTKIKIAGSGDAQVHAKDKLEAKVSGSGDIRYSGNPVQTEMKASGSGEIRRM